MAVVVLSGSPTREDLAQAREEYRDYIKITTDLARRIVAIGGEYHVDAEKILLEGHNSKQKDIWGRGFNLNLGKFETNALINLRPPRNESTEIINPIIREDFLSLTKEVLKDIKSLL